MLLVAIAAAWKVGSTFFVSQYWPWSTAYKDKVSAHKIAQEEKETQHRLTQEADDRRHRRDLELMEVSQFIETIITRAAGDDEFIKKTVATQNEETHHKLDFLIKEIGTLKSIMTEFESSLHMFREQQKAQLQVENEMLEILIWIKDIIESSRKNNRVK